MAVHIVLICHNSQLLRNNIVISNLSTNIWRNLTVFRLKIPWHVFSLGKQVPLLSSWRRRQWSSPKHAGGRGHILPWLSPIHCILAETTVKVYILLQFLPPRKYSYFWVKYVLDAAKYHQNASKGTSIAISNLHDLDGFHMIFPMVVGKSLMWCVMPTAN